MKHIRKISTVLLFLANVHFAMAQTTYDIVVVGGNPGGIMTAIAAARQNKSTLILERTNEVGGLPANGLGATDIATRNATTGLFKEFVDRIARYYQITYGKDSPQAFDCSEGYHFEPSVAQKIFQDMIAECKDKITILTMRQFDSDPANLIMKDNKIDKVKVTNRINEQTEWYEGRVFVDATYEGDLAAAAGVPYRVGRESKSEFNEIGAGKLYKYWGGPTGEGTTHAGDNAVQAYNYRLCLTKDKKNRIPFRKPANYNRSEYVSLINDVLYGYHTGSDMQHITLQQQQENARIILKGDSTHITDDRWGIAKLSNMVVLPNGKTDANNQHMAFISTDLPEENWAWPTAGWEWRDKFAQRLREYTEGLLWFAANDKALPISFRKAVSQWGYAADEYTDNQNFPRQVYVREGRRFEGLYFFTAKDALPTAIGQRPPVHSTSITASHYMLDSHAVLKREKGRIHLDGFFSYPSAIYTVPYGVMVSHEIDNLLFPVPVSGSHVGFSTLRMEPCWMALGQAAGVAASLAIDEGVKVQNVDIKKLQSTLIAGKATLVYFKDVSVNSPESDLLQKMALQGYLSGWEARCHDVADNETLSEWEALSGFRLKTMEGKTRLEVLTFINDKQQKK